MSYPLCDLHIHSIASGHAFNTIDEIITQARKKNYQLVGISDHGPDMERAPHIGYYEMLYRLPKNFGDMQILYGCEANILDQYGHIDIPDKLIASLDYVIAGLHQRTSYNGITCAEHTKAIVSAIHSKKVDIISHPISMGFLADPESIVAAAADEHVILECNKSILKEAICNRNMDVIRFTSELLEKASEASVGILFGSDAHHISEMGFSDEEETMIEDVYGFSLSKTLNTDLLRLQNLLKEKKQMRSKILSER